MAGNETLKQKYLSFEGRLNRQPYWLRNLVLVLVILLLSAPVFYLIFTGVQSGSMTVDPSTQLPQTSLSLRIYQLVVSLVILPATLSLGVRRLHDRGKSGWWLVLFYGPSIISYELSQFAPNLSSLNYTLGWVAIITSVWALIELGFLRGTNGPNRYGADPLDPTNQNA